MTTCLKVTSEFPYVTGIPYVHAYVVLYYMKRDMIDYVDEFFSVENFINTYERFGVLPNNRLDMWLDGVGAPVLPLPFKVQPSRPKKLRKIDFD